MCDSSVGPHVSETSPTCPAPGPPKRTGAAAGCGGGGVVARSPAAAPHHRTVQLYSPRNQGGVLRADYAYLTLDTTLIAKLLFLWVSCLYIDLCSVRTRSEVCNICTGTWISVHNARPFLPVLLWLLMTNDLSLGLHTWRHLNTEWPK